MNANRMEVATAMANELRDLADHMLEYAKDPTLPRRLSMLRGVIDGNGKIMLGDRESVSRLLYPYCECGNEVSNPKADLCSDCQEKKETSHA